MLSFPIFHDLCLASICICFMLLLPEPLFVTSPTSRSLITRRLGDLCMLLYILSEKVNIILHACLYIAHILSKTPMQIPSAIQPGLLIWREGIIRRACFGMRWLRRVGAIRLLLLLGRGQGAERTRWPALVCSPRFFGWGQGRGIMIGRRRGVGLHDVDREGLRAVRGRRSCMQIRISLCLCWFCLSLYLSLSPCLSISFCRPPFFLYTSLCFQVCLILSLSISLSYLVTYRKQTQMNFSMHLNWLL